MHAYARDSAHRSVSLPPRLGQPLGRSPLGRRRHFDPKHNTTFATLIRDAGYVTGVAGKWQINDFRVQPEVLREHGFDEWSMWTGYEAQNPPSAERYWSPYVFTNLTPSATFAGKFGPDVYNHFALDFIERHRNRPFLLYYPMALTHGPLVHTPDEPDVADKMGKHKAMVRYTDRLVGRLVDRLERWGLREQTYVFFTTDNGTSGGISGRLGDRIVQGGKAKLTENGPRQPFIVTGPGVARGVATDALTDFTDMLPTFVELAGAELPAGLALDGHSIAPVMLGRDAHGPREWIMAMGFGPARLDDRGVRPVEDFADRVVRDKRYKIYVVDGRVAKLYDLQADPAEGVNLIDSDRPEHRAARRKLSAVVEGFPRRDARPRYEPLPPQPWDISREANEKMWKRD